MDTRFGLMSVSFIVEKRTAGETKSECANDSEQTRASKEESKPHGEGWFL